MTFETQGYYVRGGRTGVLLMHGLCGTPTEMRFVANGLARTGCTVYCPMLAGHGGTEEDIKGTTWQDWYASAERALDRLREDCDTVIVGGLSTGAVLALLLAARRPADVQGTALLAPTLWLNGWLIPWYAHLFRLVFSKRIANLIGFPDLHPHGIKDERIREFIRNALFSGDSSVAGLPSTPGGAVLEHRRLVQAARAELGQIHQPALIIHPREDDYADLDNAWYLQRQLKGMVDMVVLDDSYHIVTVDRQRHVVVERTAAFVANVAQRMGAKAGAIAGTAAPVRAAA
ncbi:MAG: alpha/beta hydrolase [Alphaproteobacteria bacterium 64-6]|nr:MAG: alpha/beta hydrolase [Alphaproteobacteria bacterium 64-6]